ncbi:MAG: hypothetical protein U0U67_02080 [Chitinophagales bacterium]
MRKLLSFVLFVMIHLLITAQAPNQINYQGVARNASGNPLPNQSISVRLKVHDVSATGTVVYSETRNLTTNASGLFTIVIGSSGATNVSGTVSGINWSTGNKFLEVEIDPAGGSSFTSLGTSQLNSVPYSINAKQADGLASTATINPNQITANGATNGQVLKWNGSAWAPGTDIQASGGATYSAGTGISINGSNVISNTGDLSNTNELQSLTLTGNQLSISNGNSVTLPTGTTYTAGSGITISGNTIFNAGDLSTTNELQTISKSGSTITLSNGGGSVVDNDVQTLSVSGNQLSITNGNSVTLPTGTTYTAGSGINIVGNIIQNTGDLNPLNDLTDQTIAGGDLSGLLYAPTVEKIQGRIVSGTAPTNGQVLAWNNSTLQWTPNNLPNPSTTSWSLTGNPSLLTTDYLGTPNDVPVVFKSKNIELLRLTGSNTTLNMNGQVNILKDYRQLDLKTPTLNEYSRLSFSNANNATRYWDMVAKIDNTGLANDDFAIWNAGSGPAIQFTGDRKVKFFNALMPNNNAGANGQVLASTGANTAPTWVSSTNTLYNNTYFFEQTANANLSTDFISYTLPGLDNMSFTTSGPAKVIVTFSHGWIENDDNIAGGDMKFFVNMQLKLSSSVIKNREYAIKINNGERTSLSFTTNSTLTTAGTYTIALTVGKIGDNGHLVGNPGFYTGEVTVQVIPQ